MGIFCFAISLKADQWGDWTYASDGTNVTITGYTGSEFDEANYNIIVPDAISSMPVVAIADYAFQDYFGLTITISAEVTSIGDYAFGNSTSLKTVSIPSNTTHIGVGAFFLCSGLSSIVIPPSVKSIESNTFMDCHSLTNVVIPATVTNIGSGVFYHCYNLSNIILPPNLTSIRYQTFQNCISLKEIIIPEGVTNIEWYAFMYCSQLENAVIPDSVSLIEEFAFFGCDSLTNIDIPASVSFLGTGVFAAESHLLSIAVNPSNLFYSSTNDMLFNKSQTVLIQCPSGKKTDLFIPANVMNVGDYAFGSCSGLTNMVIPDGITNIGQYAFYSCASLLNVGIPASVTNIGDSGFAWCTSLTSMYFKGNAPFFGSSVFDWDDILTIYYYPWTTGWTNTFGGRPTQINPAYTQWLLNNNFATNGISSTTNDFDNDGMLNWQEYLAGTNPTNDADKLAISSMGSGTNTALLTWLAKSNVSYQVMKSSDLQETWGNAPSGQGTNQQSYQVAPTDGLLQYADPNYAGATNGFYRVNVVQ